MTTLDTQINMNDIECPTLRSQVKAMIEDLVELCPSDSSVRATFSKIHDKFLADIRVASESVVMHAKDQAYALSEVMEHIKSKMLNQIVDWRAHRFAS